MNSVNVTRSPWQPQTSEDRDAILSELRAVLASPHFSHSKRYPALLQYIVENTLTGRTDLLKERTLGVEVFDRPPTYDTNADTVVRYTAGEVRKRLLLYYSEAGHKSSVRISLPVGSYIPEFLSSQDALGETRDSPGSATAHSYDEESLAYAGIEERDHGITSHANREGGVLHSSAGAGGYTGQTLQPSRSRLSRLMWLALAATVLIVVIIVAELVGRHSAIPSQTAVDDFWAPILHDGRSVVVCTGGSVFDQNNFSGVMTAGKNIDYPFVSMQSASAIAQISGKLERSGATTQLVFAGSEPLTELREHSVALIGGYNNEWTMRLLQPLRFYFPPEPIEAIVDQQHPEVHWARDKSLPYSSGDDFALVARFRDPTIDGWVVVVAGLGRNGTEAAAQFATSSHYLKLLRDQIGGDFSNRNIEAVLKVRVIDGKTGAPSILAVQAW
jgi:hypothetical protein